MLNNPLAGKTVMEIGRGSGRVARDLGMLALNVTATDTGWSRGGKGKNSVAADNVALTRDNVGK